MGRSPAVSCEVALGLKILQLGYFVPLLLSLFFTNMLCFAVLIRSGRGEMIPN